MDAFITETLATLGALFLMFVGLGSLLLFLFCTAEGKDEQRKHAVTRVMGMRPLSCINMTIFGRNEEPRIALHIIDKASYANDVYVLFGKPVGGSCASTRCVPVIQVIFEAVEIGATIVVAESLCAT